MLFQSACHVAQRYKESESGRKVLVIDFSLYSEVSSLLCYILMGGQRPQDEIGLLSDASVIWRRIHTYYVVIKHVLRVGFHVIRAHDTLRVT